MSESRFIALAQPVAAPGCCFICRSATNGPFVDTQINVKFEGALVICAACIRDMHNQLPRRVSALENRAYDLGYQKATNDFRAKLAPVVAGIGSLLATATDA